TFLGGVFRFSDNGARYGVHRASLPLHRASGELDLGQDLSTAIGSYMREMGVDARLLELWAKAAPGGMYVLSPREARELGVFNEGRRPPEWSIAPFPGGTMLQGRQATSGGTGTVFFSCDDRRIVLGSVFEAAGRGAPVTAQGWSHVVSIDAYEEIPFAALATSSAEGVVRATFIVPPDLIRLAMFAKQIGHRMKPPGSSPPIGFSVDVDDRSARLVQTFLGSCLRRQAR
ncbi:MAG TPA: hypothetical protein VEL75_02730, partial [Candidatus Methylomirabilis sp.]|nr:hypothetical protein [Candidatus Methylomirabilis sp.]